MFNYTAIMPKLKLNFITLHYAYIVLMGIIGLLVIYPAGNMPAVDAYFFGVSSATESGLNTIDVKDLMLYQQLVIYFIPIFTNLGFINILVVIVRLYWFNKTVKEHQNLSGETSRLSNSIVAEKPCTEMDLEAQPEQLALESLPNEENQQRVTFAPDATLPGNEPNKALHVPGPRDREQGHPIVETDNSVLSDDGDEIQKVLSNSSSSHALRRRATHRRRLSGSKSLEQVAPSIFILGATRSQERPAPSRRQSETSLQTSLGLPALSRQATLGRNSNFKNLTAADRELLGGMEYRALRLLLKIVIGYFVGLHLFGALFLLPWIYTAEDKYTSYLDGIHQDKAWWAFYSAQTMVDNLGFTLTPDSMIMFRDAVWPMLLMTFLAFAGNTFYPVFLRLLIWSMYKLSPKKASIHEPLGFLLRHPRRCYTLLFGSSPTWILFIILFSLNFIDVLLIILLDLDNSEVNVLTPGKRIVAALFQAASSRHTGTATFNLALVNPAVQFSLLVMMYIAVFPIAVSIRASNTYEESSLGIYEVADELDEDNRRSYLLRHMQNQLSFDLWYIFLGIFCICAAESGKIMDATDPAFAVFPIFFEIVSAYGNVGLSLGHPSVFTSLSGKFTPFSKLVICAMMIRGRHRGLPYALDRAIMLPKDPVKASNLDTQVDKGEGVTTMSKAPGNQGKS